MLTIDFERLAIKPGEYVLDLGCGEGRHCLHAWLQYSDINAVGVDLNFDDLATARAKLESFSSDPQARGQDKHIALYCADGLNLPFADHSFDTVICSEVLEHIPDYRGVLDEIRRVLKPSGVLAVSVPRAWPERICWWLSEAYHRVEGGHIRIFNAGKLKHEIDGLGFRHSARHWAHALHVPFWWLKCVFWNSQEKNPLIRAYHKLLVWDLMQRPFITRAIETLLNPVMGKSVVMYFKKDLQV